MSIFLGRTYTEFSSRIPYRKWKRGQHWAPLASVSQCCPLIHFFWVILLPNLVLCINEVGHGAHFSGFWNLATLSCELVMINKSTISIFHGGMETRDEWREETWRDDSVLCCVVSLVSLVSSEMDPGPLIFRVLGRFAGEGVALTRRAVVQVPTPTMWASPIRHRWSRAGQAVLRHQGRHLGADRTIQGDIKIR